MRIIGASIASAPSDSSRSTSSPACSRDRVTTIRLPNSGRSSNHRRCWRSAATRPTTRMAGLCRRLFSAMLLQRALDCLLGRQRAVIDDRRRCRPCEAVGEERLENFRELLRSRIAHHRAAQPRERAPVDRRRGGALVFVPAHECHRVSAAGVRDGHAGIARRADRRRNAGTTSNITPCSCRNSAS